MKWLALFSVSLILITSCKTSRNNGELLFWTSNNAQEIEFAQNRINQWNQDNPDKNFFFQPIPEGQSSEEIILASVVGKTTPDIYANM